MQTTAGDAVVERQTKIKQLKKLKCCSICFLVTGLILVITSCFTPKAFDSILVGQAKKGAYLTQANEADWDGIPGSRDLGIYWNQYFYNCTNAKDVSAFDACLNGFEFVCRWSTKT